MYDKSLDPTRETAKRLLVGKKKRVIMLQNIFLCPICIHKQRMQMNNIQFQLALAASKMFSRRKSRLQTVLNLGITVFKMFI